MIAVRLPIRTYSLANQREHWRVRAKRAKQERLVAFASVPKHSLPCVVSLTREGPRNLDGDNLQGSFKSLRDGIADRLGVDDGDERIEWRYGQTKSKKYGITIEITGAST